MKISIVINSYSQNKSLLHKASRIKEECIKLGLEADILLASDFYLSSSGNINVEGAGDICFYLDKDNYLAKALDKKTFLVNSYHSLVLSDDKMLSILELDKLGIKVPLTIPSPLCYIDNENTDVREKFLNFVEKKLHYPLVFKECHGSLGKQVALIKDRKELEDYYQKYKKIPHLYEEYISFNKGEDYRLFFVGDKLLAAIKRKNEHDFRSNIALGGKGYIATVPSSFIDVGRKVMKAFNLYYAGIDIKEDEDGSPLFLEVNSNAFFDEVEKVCDINVAKEIVTYALKLFRK